MTHKIIISVPHTGTRFLKERLGIHEHCHTNANWRHIERQVHGKQIVTPLRNPSDVWRSWCRRRHRDDLTKWVAQFFVSWGVLHTLDQMYDIDYICIDKCEDPRIDDWSKVGDKDESVADWRPHGIDLRPLFKLPLVQEHYSSWAKPVK